MKKAEKLEREQEEKEKQQAEKEGEKSEKEEALKLEAVKTETVPPDACTVTVEGGEDTPTDNPMSMTEDATDREDVHQSVI